MNEVNLESTTVDDVFDALCATRRRAVIETPRTRSPPLDLDTVAEAVAERESARERDVRSTLHHVHLPKLQHVGLLDYDTERKTIHGNQDDIERALERADGALTRLRGDSRRSP